MKTLEQFQSLIRAGDPAGLSGGLLALYHDARGDWHAAHEVAQGLHDRDAAWIHAYLHRKEGDLDNAAYWYGQARRSVMTGSFDDEWRAMAEHLLGQGREA